MKYQYNFSQYRKLNYLKEQQRLTKFAPHINCKGPHIRNHEELIRVAIFPDHTNDDGSLRAEAISRTDLTRNGFSIYRTKYTTRDTVNNLVQKYVDKNPERKLQDLLIFHAREIRGIKDKYTYQAFVIIDDEPDIYNKGHALILCAEKHKPSHIKELRSKIAELINNPRSMDDVFSS